MMDAFFQAYTNIDAVKASIGNFLRYGGRQIYLVSDGGDDFSSLKDCFGEALIYKHEPRNVRVGYWEDKFECREWFSRIHAASLILTSPRIMILEEDVMVQGDLPSMIFKYEISGPRLHHTNNINPDVQEFIRRHGKRLGVYSVYGGCGGSVFNRKIFLENYDWFIELLMSHYEELDEMSLTLIRHQDYCLTLLFNLAGYEYGENPYYTEPCYGEDYNRMKDEKRILHHFDER